jgi:hypothetical protein
LATSRIVARLLFPGTLATLRGDSDNRSDESCQESGSMADRRARGRLIVLDLVLHRRLIGKDQGIQSVSGQAP